MAKDPTWNVKRNDNGEAIEAGYQVPDKGIPEEDRYKDPCKDVIEEIKGNRIAKKAAIWNHDTSEETDVVKFLYDFLKKNHGRLS